MSRIRTGLTPDAWRDEGDARARVAGYGNGSRMVVTAVPVGQMQPMVTYPGSRTAAAIAHDHVRAATRAQRRAAKRAARMAGGS